MADIAKTIERKMPDDHDSGTVTLEENWIIWHNTDLVFLQLDLNDVVVIGEYTNSNGPWFEDWFITFVTKDNKWSSIPIYANNIKELLELLAFRFDPSLKDCRLANSTSWKSIVRYPMELEGIELFQKVPSKNFKSPKNLFQKLLFSLGLGNFNRSLKLELSQAVKIEVSKACA
jgi:hypothetical protein